MDLEREINSSEETDFSSLVADFSMIGLGALGVYAIYMSLEKVAEIIAPYLDLTNYFKIF